MVENYWIKGTLLTKYKTKKGKYKSQLYNALYYYVHYITTIHECSSYEVLFYLYYPVIINFIDICPITQILATNKVGGSTPSHAQPLHPLPPSLSLIRPVITPGGRKKSISQCLKGQDEGCTSPAPALPPATGWRGT